MEESRTIQAIAEGLAKIIESGRTEKPIETKVPEAEHPRLEKLISHPRSIGLEKKLVGFKTYTFLDKLYNIDGIPSVAQIGITGLPSSR